MGVVITYAYIEAELSIGNGRDCYRKHFKFKKNKPNRYNVKVQFHGPDKFNHKTGIAAIKNIKLTASLNLAVLKIDWRVNG